MPLEEQDRLLITELQNRRMLLRFGEVFAPNSPLHLPSKTALADFVDNAPALRQMLTTSVGAHEPVNPIQARTELFLEFEGHMPLVKWPVLLRFGRLCVELSMASGHHGVQTQLFRLGALAMCRAVDSAQRPRPTEQRTTSLSTANLQKLRRFPFDALLGVISETALESVGLDTQADLLAPIETCLRPDQHPSLRREAQQCFDELENQIIASLDAAMLLAETHQNEAKIMARLLRTAVIFHYPEDLAERLINEWHALAWRLYKAGEHHVLESIFKEDGHFLFHVSSQFLHKQRLLHLAQEISQLLCFRGDNQPRLESQLADYQRAFDVDPANINARRNGARAYAMRAKQTLRTGGSNRHAEAEADIEIAKKFDAKSPAIAGAEAELERARKTWRF